MVLVLDADVEQHVVQCVEDAGEPRRHRIGVDSQRNTGGRPATAHLRKGLGLQQCGLRRQPQQRSARRGGDTRFLPHHHDLTDPLLQRLDALADRRRSDVEPGRGGIERPVLDHRRECRQLLSVDLHISDANAK
jgi:hypothetical protein